MTSAENTYVNLCYYIQNMGQVKNEYNESRNIKLCAYVCVYVYVHACVCTYLCMLEHVFNDGGKVVWNR